jgi:hypothetical protein
MVLAPFPGSRSLMKTLTIIKAKNKPKCTNATTQIYTLGKYSKGKANAIT